MKSIKIVALVLGILFLGNAVNAQKIAAVDGQGLVYALPDMQGVQQKMETFARDTIGPEFTRLSSEYHIKDSTYRDAKTPESVKKSLEQPLSQLAETLQSWQGIASNANQVKQNELMAPLYQKVMTAINAVAKEKGYTYVLTREAVLVMPDTDDITLLVANKLGIKPQGQQATGAGTAPAAKPAAPKPATPKK